MKSGHDIITLVTSYVTAINEKENAINVIEQGGIYRSVEEGEEKKTIYVEELSLPDMTMAMSMRHFLYL